MVKIKGVLKRVLLGTGICVAALGFSIGYCGNENPTDPKVHEQVNPIKIIKDNLEQVINSDRDNERAGNAAVELSSLEFDDDNISKAKELLTDISENKIKANAKVKKHAEARLALYNKDIDTAIKNLKKIETDNGQDASVSLDLANAYREKIKKDKSGHEECRSYCKKVLDSTENTKEQSKFLRASAEKINLESYFLEANFKKVEELAKDYEIRYPDQPKKKAQVWWLEGTSLRREFKRKESHEVFEKIRQNLKDEDAKGELRELKAEAFYDLGLWYRDQGDRLNENYTYEQLIEKYPNSTKARLVKEMIDSKKNK